MYVELDFSAADKGRLIVECLLISGEPGIGKKHEMINFLNFSIEKFFENFFEKFFWKIFENFFEKLFFEKKFEKILQRLVLMLRFSLNFYSIFTAEYVDQSAAAFPAWQSLPW